MTIESHADVRLYFREQVQLSLEERHITTSEPTEFYLVNLLAAFAAKPPSGSSDTFGIDLHEALDLPSDSERLRSLRDLGDRTLYRTGFFAESLEHRRIPRTYVIDIGKRAYQAAEVVAQRGDPARVAVFHDLSARLEMFSAVLSDVRERTTLRTPQDIIRLYERWKQTRSPEIARRLEMEGVFPALHQDDADTLH